MQLEKIEVVYLEYKGVLRHFRNAIKLERPDHILRFETYENRRINVVLCSYIKDDVIYVSYSYYSSGWIGITPLIQRGKVIGNKLSDIALVSSCSKAEESLYNSKAISETGESILDSFENMIARAVKQSITTNNDNMDIDVRVVPTTSATITFYTEKGDLIGSCIVYAEGSIEPLTYTVNERFLSYLEILKSALRTSGVMRLHLGG